MYQFSDFSEVSTQISPLLFEPGRNHYWQISPASLTIVGKGEKVERAQRMVHRFGSWQVVSCFGKKASIFSEEGRFLAFIFVAHISTNQECLFDIKVLLRKDGLLQEDALEYLCDYKVPVSRALWFLKLIAVGGQGCSSNVNKQKKSTSDQLASGKFAFRI